MVERKGMRRERRNPYTYKTGIMEHNNNDFFKERAQDIVQVAPLLGKLL